MNLLSITLIGVGLSIDSLAASITTGACSKNIRLKHILKVASFMAFFQGTMPLVGWLIGSSFKSIIEDYDHWVAFFLLLGIGSKLIYDGIIGSSDEMNSNPTKNMLLAGMAIATSIDAMILGIGFGLIEINIWLAMLIIGSTTFLFSTIGVFVGEKLGNKINKGIEIFGGIVLIGLGLKILLEHIYY
ncbi:manganese efflux pump MntP [Carboxylicivirga marina]|uniref:Putative manganese efflux pump MntP n=1 Tax=Carboxylicivirga marina TaxID=2800988 RepID=A0ABS1HQJ3_9BACT|nr:manganese efflux pump MntP family protein [Carboxylicivirga marina]MBK3519916.1 manganese efflux pump [Carboxylicivirga marina]